jgi:hypothetical protein
VDGVFLVLVAEAVEHGVEGVPIPGDRTAEAHWLRQSAVRNQAVKRRHTDRQVGRSATGAHCSRRVGHLVTGFFTRHVLDTSLY